MFLLYCSEGVSTKVSNRSNKPAPVEGAVRTSKQSVSAVSQSVVDDKEIRKANVAGPSE